MYAIDYNTLPMGGTMAIPFTGVYSRKYIDPKTAAMEDVKAGRWNPGQFCLPESREAYGKAWDYFYHTIGRG